MGRVATTRLARPFAIWDERLCMDAVTIIGAGGIGCAVGHALAGNGVGVTFVDIAGEKLARGREEGVRVDQLPARQADFVTFAEWSPQPGQTILLCTKGYDNKVVLARLPPAISLIPIQNGFDEDLQRWPAHVEGIASFVSECIPGRPHTRITRGGQLHLGVNPGAGFANGERLQDRAQELAASLSRAAFSVSVVPDILPFKYTKLMYNAAISPLAAAAGLDNGEILRHPRVRSLFFALLRENYAILEQQRLPLGKVGPLAPATVARILRRPWLAHLLAFAFYPSLRGAYCSMFNDLPRGRTEIDQYNGFLLQMANPGMAPLNARILDLIHTMEREHTPPALAALEPVLAAFENAQQR